MKIDSSEIFRIAAAADTARIAVIIPCFRVTDHVLSVIGRIGPGIEAIYCVDDACPEGSGKLIERQSSDTRVKVLHNSVNCGVGGAVLAGYRQALADGFDILVKIDGDGQMDPALMPELVRPILSGEADYTKGNRFFFLEHTRGMPFVRLIGNGMLSFLTKLSSGYWTIFDPTNGYTAIHRSVAEQIVSRRIDERYFFETDMLLHLYLLRAVIRDVPMASVYADERSNLSVRRVALPFFAKNLRNMLRRFLVHYLIRDFSLASLEAIVGTASLTFGTVFGALAWGRSYASGAPATAGEVMIAALPILTGVQLILSALNFDMRNVPAVPRQRPR
jgi:dolichol-phosphate mannosyltransferase